MINLTNNRRNNVFYIKNKNFNEIKTPVNLELLKGAEILFNKNEHEKVI